MHSENADQKIRSILSKILEEYDLGLRTPSILSLRMDDFLKDIDVDRFLFLKVLAGLKSKKLITTFLLRKGSKVRSEHDDKQDFDTCGIGLGVDFRNKAEQYLNELSKEAGNNSTLILYLDEKGNFWHGDKEKVCYPIEATSARFKLLKYLIENKSNQETTIIATYLGKKAQNIRTEIGKINKNIFNYLGLDDVIINDRGLGYEINPKYKIKIIK
jgi:hypothetical protein